MTSPASFAVTALKISFPDDYEVTAATAVEIAAPHMAPAIAPIAGFSVVPARGYLLRRDMNWRRRVADDGLRVGCGERVGSGVVPAVAEAVPVGGADAVGGVLMVEGAGEAASEADLVPVRYLAIGIITVTGSGSAGGSAARHLNRH